MRTSGSGESGGEQLVEDGRQRRANVNQLVGNLDFELLLDSSLEQLDSSSVNEAGKVRNLSNYYSYEW